MEEKTTIVDLMRHGEPEGGRMYRGQKDDPLSNLGWSQMSEAVADCHHWDVIVSSPLQRCARFAEALAAERDLPLEVDEAFREISFGVWEGRRPGELEAEDPEGMRAFWDDPVRYWPEGGEPFDRFQLRIAAAWERLLQRYAGRHTLLVAHGGVIRAVLFHVLGVPPQNFFRIQVPYASFSRIRADADGRHPHLVFHGGRP
ncbi:MAG: alpha-ribazole phosphatase family protein [Gammaproteobacteria bacterium]